MRAREWSAAAGPEGLGTAAAVAAVAVVGVVSTGAGRDTTAPPAGHSATQGARTAEAVLNATSPSNQQFAVRLGGDGRVTYHAVDPPPRGGGPRWARAGVPASGFTWATGAAAPGVVLAVLPEDAVFGEPVVQPLNEEPFQVSSRPSRGNAVQGSGRGLREGVGREGFRGIVWQTPDETMHGPSGEVAAAQFPSLASPFPSSVWADPSVGAYGLNGMGPISQQPLPTDGLAFHTTIAPDGEDEITTVFGVAREGSTSLKAVFGDSSLDLEAKELPGTELVAFHAEVRRPTGAGPLTAVQWKDRSGTARSTSVLGR